MSFSVGKSSNFEIYILTMKTEPECYTERQLSEFTTYRIGGLAKKLYIPRNVEQLERIYKRILDSGEELLLIGGGSNLLISDRGFSGSVIVMRECCGRINSYGSKFNCGAGVKLETFIVNVIRSGFAGVERLAGIPGALGGALTMNAGAYLSEITDFLTSVNVLDERGNRKNLSKNEIRFAYRCAPGLYGKLILGAEFDFSQCDRVGPAKMACEILQLRRSKHPWQYPSAGSVFKHHPYGAAGRLIDQFGLKGKRIGDAKISTKHANFIINLGNARAIEVLALIRLIQRKIEQEYDIELDLEQKLVGFTEAELADPDKFL